MRCSRVGGCHAPAPSPRSHCARSAGPGTRSRATAGPERTHPCKQAGRGIWGGETVRWGNKRVCIKDRHELLQPVLNKTPVTQTQSHLYSILPLITSRFSNALRSDWLLGQTSMYRYPDTARENIGTVMQIQRTVYILPKKRKAMQCTETQPTVQTNVSLKITGYFAQAFKCVELAGLQH